ncbi:MAG: hypothetical protein ACXVJT_14420, partial [Thermoanaerobaculia bacterium]
MALNFIPSVARDLLGLSYGVGASDYSLVVRSWGTVDPSLRSGLTISRRHFRPFLIEAADLDLQKLAER